MWGGIFSLQLCEHFVVLIESVSSIYFQAKMVTADYLV